MIEALGQHPFLEGMSQAHLSRLAACAMPVSFEAGGVVFREGDPANRFYLLTEGTVLLEAEGLEVERIGSGDVLGWSWLFPPYRWVFTARTDQPIKGYFLYGTRLRECCEEDPEFGYELLKRVSRVVIHRLQRTRASLSRAMGHPGPLHTGSGRFADATALHATTSSSAAEP